MQQPALPETGRQITYKADLSFRNKLNTDSETLNFCYQCGACTSVCPISKFISIYKPSTIMQLAKLGIRDMPHSNAFLFCSACELCTKGCPQGVKIHEVMESLKDAMAAAPDILKSIKFDTVLESLSESMPFPVTYSWICLRPTEKSALGTAVLDSFKRFLAQPMPDKINLAPDAKKAAVIGSGPAGLTLAWALIRSGIQVTVYETLEQPGGMLRTGIPEYRLPKYILDDEIDRIKALGVDLKVATRVDKDLFEEVVQNTDYIFIASGAYASRNLHVIGADLEGVIPAIELLQQYNTSGSAKVGKKVVVIGGGNVAMDAAGAALRSGAESVHLFCLEDRNDMPAHPWEIREMEDDGVSINPGWGPKVIQGDKNVMSVEFIKCKSVIDEDGNFNPVFDEKKTITAEADTVVVAIGQSPNLDFLNKYIETFRSKVVTDSYTQKTSFPGVYAGGDAALGTASLIEAILAGKTAAKTIIQGNGGVSKA